MWLTLLSLKKRTWLNGIYGSILMFILNVDFMLCSTSSNTWDAFQLALASFRMYCVQNHVSPSNSMESRSKVGPQMFGDPPIIDFESGMDEEENSPETSALKIYDDDVNMRFLVCGVPSMLVCQN